MTQAPSIVVDGRIFQTQATGGISRLYAETLPRVCALEPGARVRLVTEGPVAGHPPTHPRIARRRLPDSRRILRPGRLFAPVVAPTTAAVRRLGYGSGRGRIWHSTYYTTPTHWRGPQVVTVYDMIHERFAASYDRPQDEALRAAKATAVERADRVITISRATADDLLDILGPHLEDRVQIIPLAPSGTFTPAQDADETASARPFLLHVGGRAGYKDFDGLLEAYAQWPGHREVDLVTVGRAWTADEARRLAALGLADRVRLVPGPITDAELLAHYREAVALVHPSRAEGFGIPVLEALACGCPVVAARIPPTEEIAGDTPLWFEPGAPDDLRRALDEGRRARGDRERIMRGIAQAARFTWDDTARATLAAYRSVL